MSIDSWDASMYPAFPVGIGRTLYYDTEADGLMLADRNAKGEITKKAATKFHCLAFVDVNTGEQFYFGTDQAAGSGRTIADGLRFLGECAVAIAHNGLGFDAPALDRLYPDRKQPAKEWDSLIFAKLIWPTDILKGPDFERIKRGTFPGHMLGRHSLAAWGHRLGEHKGDYKDGFDVWSPAMAAYMMQDIKTGVALWRLILKRINWVETPDPSVYTWPELPFWIEHEAQRIIVQQEVDGVRFDIERARLLVKDLKNQQKRLDQRLVSIFGSWWQPLHDIETGHCPASDRDVSMVGYPDITLPRVSEKTGKELAPYVGPPKCEYRTNAPYVDIEWTTFNPGSRDHLGQRLQAVFGWRPKAYGKNAKPTVDETVLASISEMVMPAEVRQDILDYFVVSKTLGTLSQGSKSWIEMATTKSPDGRVHGRMDTLGAITRRGTHKDPNLSGTPSVKKEKVLRADGTKQEVVLRGLAGRYGYECRELFMADDEQTGIDMSSLELILLGHNLWPYDGGAFSSRVCDPLRDPHQEHADIAGMLRADAKTTIYLLIYGGSAYKLSIDPNFTVKPEEIVDYLKYKGLRQLLSHLYKRMGEDFAKLDEVQQAKLAKAKITITKLSEGITGLSNFMEDVQATAARGWLKAMDGGKLYVRKTYAAPNTLLQGNGAVACKLWMVLLHKSLKEAHGLMPGRDFKQMLWVHDELQFTHRPGLGPLIARVAEECAVRAGEMLNLRGRFRTDSKHGRNWAECH